MPRTYIPKKDPNEQQMKLNEAVRRIKEDNLSIREAAEEQGLKKSTLHSYITFNKSKEGFRKPGNPLNIPEEAENELAASLKTMARWGFPLSRGEIKRVVSDFVSANKGETTPLSEYLKRYCRFRNNVPGEDWISAFMVRHHLSSKKPSTLERARVVATSDPFLIYEFFDLVEDELNKLELKEKPSHIYNLDETSLYFDPSRTKAVAEKGVKFARVTATPGRESTTVMACVSAAGECHPPLIIFTGKKLQSTWRGKDVDKNLTLAISENGWMSTEIFDKWFDIFCQQVTKRPLLIIYDGHKTHMSLSLISKARRENISIIKLPAHTTDVLQPLDKCCFKPLKTQWDKKLVVLQRDSGAHRVSKARFTELVDEVWPIALTKDNITSGFRSTGIFPLDRSKYPVKRFAPQMLASYNLQYSPSKILYTEMSSANPIPRVTVPCTLHDKHQPSTSYTPQPVSAAQTTALGLKSLNTTNQTSPSISFEDILRKRLQTSPRIARSETRRRIDTNSAVITHDEFLKLIEKNEKEKAAKGKKKKTAKETIVENKENCDDEEESPSKKRSHSAYYETSGESEAPLEDNVFNIDQLTRVDTIEQTKVKLQKIQESIKQELYYAVYYEQGLFYIGKVTKVENQSIAMRFLEKGAGNFRWPKRIKEEKVNVRYIFYGPIHLHGSDPFCVADEEIVTAYKCYKKARTEIWK